MAINVLARMAKRNGSKRLCDYWEERQEVMDDKDRNYIIDYQVEKFKGLSSFLYRCSKLLKGDEARRIIYAICDPTQISSEDRLELKMNEKTYITLFAKIINGKELDKLINDIVENDLLENFLYKFSYYLQQEEQQIEREVNGIIAEAIVKNIDRLVVTNGGKNRLFNLLLENAYVPKHILEYEEE